MKLIELEITNIRGIKHLKLNQNGENFVIYGPNGSGKSTVVDAIDFLLTGQIKRLTGEGTGQLTLRRHGPHIDYKPDEAKVRMLIKVKDLEEPIELTRCMGQPRNLEYDKSKEPYIEPILSLAKRGHYILTRKEILNYITSSPGNRAQQIQDLLNLNEIELIRKNLVKISNKFKNEYESVKQSLDLSIGAILETANLKDFNENEIINFISNNRKNLNGNPITELNLNEIKKDLSPPIIKRQYIIQDIEFQQKPIEHLIEILSFENQMKIQGLENNLRENIKIFKKIPNQLKELKRFELTKLGLELVEHTGECPLCDTVWENGKLQEYLKNKISKIKNISDIFTHIKNSTEELKKYTSFTLESIQTIVGMRKEISIKYISLFKSWLGRLIYLLKLLDGPLDKLIDIDFDPYNLKNMLAPENALEILNQIKPIFGIKSIKITPEQLAWDNLTRLEENLKIYLKAKEHLDSKYLIYNRAETLKDSFQIARDKTLGSLYDTIRDRFVELYKEIHGLDENGFSAKLEPEQAGINLEVDFYGKGSHPPHALHSEGHQDSMGICLYLSLAEKISQDLIDLIILDDVVMSIDSDHRRSVCNVFKMCFPDKQFLITTHDKTWMNQLRTENVIKSKNLVEFYNWNIETGPQHKNLEMDMWKNVYEYLHNRDIPNSAFTLRRGLEQFFNIVCDNLQAKVVYKISSRYELADFLKPSIGKYNELLKKAKASAQSWQKNELFRELDAMSSIISQIFDRTYTEQWAINSTVHYNNWANLSMNDFKPVVEAFEDLCQLFICGKCGGIIRLLKDNSLQDVNVTCGCGSFNWNLQRKN